MKLPCLSVILLVFLSVCASAQGPEGAELQAGELQIQTERTRIERTRAQKTAELDAEDAACATKFAVTDCQSTVASRRRQMLAELKRQEVALNAAQRQQKGLNQLRLGEKKAHQQEEARKPTGEASTTDRQAAQDEKVRAHRKRTINYVPCAVSG